MLTKLFFRQFARQIRKSQFLNQFNQQETEKIIDQDIFSDKFESQNDPMQITEKSKQKDIVQKVQENELIEEEEEQMTQKELEFVRETLLYQGEDQYPDKLVNRPEKQVVWGLGGELLRVKKQKFRKNRNPTVEEVINFLELEQCKDISLVDMRELGRTDMPDHCIIATTYSESHGFKVGKNLVTAVDEIQTKKFLYEPKLYGRRDDGWILVCLKEININLQTEETRNEINLEHKWKNPVSEEYQMEMEKVTMKKKKKAIYQPLDE